MFNIPLILLLVCGAHAYVKELLANHTGNLQSSTGKSVDKVVDQFVDKLFTRAVGGPSLSSLPSFALPSRRKTTDSVSSFALPPTRKGTEKAVIQSQQRAAKLDRTTSRKPEHLERSFALNSPFSASQLSPSPVGRVPSIRPPSQSIGRVSGSTATGRATSSNIDTGRASFFRAPKATSTIIGTGRATSFRAPKATSISIDTGRATSFRAPKATSISIDTGRAISIRPPKSSTMGASTLPLDKLRDVFTKSPKDISLQEKAMRASTLPLDKLRDAFTKSPKDTSLQEKARTRARTRRALTLPFHKLRDMFTKSPKDGSLLEKARHDIKKAREVAAAEEAAAKSVWPDTPSLTRRSTIVGASMSGVADMAQVERKKDMALFLQSVPGQKEVRDCSGLNARGLRVAITGSSSGIGLEAAKMLYTCGADVILLNRNKKRIASSIDFITGDGEPPEDAGTLEGMVCDLSSLSSVNAAADALANSKKPLDVLCLNAGVQFTGENVPRITEDGFETTLQVNHLAQFLLAERLLPKLAESRKNRLLHGDDTPSRIVVTASEVHDPDSKTSKQEPLGANAGLGALRGLTGTEQPGTALLNGQAFDAHKMYKDTKLCNVMFMYELERRLESVGITPKDIAVNSFSPGLITESGFFRNQNKLGVKVFDFVGSTVTGISETAKNGGQILANMAANPDFFSGSNGYWSNEVMGNLFYTGHKFINIPTSTESHDAEEAARLYDISARLVGLDVQKLGKEAQHHFLTK